MNKLKKSGNLKNYFWWITAGILCVLTIFITIETSTSGFEIAKLEKESATLTSENQELSNNLVGGMSLNSIAQKSQELGFDKPEKVVYVNGQNEVAKLP